MRHYPNDEHTPQVIAWIERSLGPGARVVSLAGMRASQWFAEKHLVEVALDDGSTRRLVLRRFHDGQRLTHDPWYDPANEALALRLLADTAVPAPQLQAVDLEGTACGEPLLLESWLPGSPVWNPGDLDGYLARVAEVLVAIHAVNVPSGAELVRYAPYYERKGAKSPPLSTRPDLWERVAAVLDSPRPADREVFIHRDYHPNNVLVDGTQVTGVVDWLTAAWGPPGIDLARMSLNLTFHHERDVAGRFTAAYVAAGGDPSARNPYWDLLDAVDLVQDLPDESEIEVIEDYVEGVLAEVR